MDATLFAPDVPVIVQGITGRTGRIHAGLMRKYGTRVVGGVAAPGRETYPIDGIPVFASCAAAVAATGARASLMMVGPFEVLSATREAFAAGVKLAVCAAEGVPVHDTMRAVRMARDYGAVFLGPSTPGVAVPGRMKIGFLPDVSLRPGPLGVISKSGTLSYEICYRLARRGVGQSLWVGVGGDAVKGVRFADLLPVFAADPATRGLVVIGEIGGAEEEELAEAMLRQDFAKPTYAILAGSNAPEGVTMGHAGALVQGGLGTVASKSAALMRAGVEVCGSISELVDLAVSRLAPQAEAAPHPAQAVAP